jgi:hypothetical protein
MSTTAIDDIINAVSLNYHVIEKYMNFKKIVVFIIAVRNNWEEFKLN